jgi:hypothetical protein
MASHAQQGVTGCREGITQEFCSMPILEMAAQSEVLGAQKGRLPAELTSTPGRHIVLQSCHKAHKSPQQGKRSRQMLPVSYNHGQKHGCICLYAATSRLGLKKRGTERHFNFPKPSAIKTKHQERHFPHASVSSPPSLPFVIPQPTKCANPRATIEKQCFIRGGQRSGSRRSGGNCQQAYFNVKWGKHTSGLLVI